MVTNEERTRVLGAEQALASMQTTDALVIRQTGGNIAPATLGALKGAMFNGTMVSGMNAEMVGGKKLGRLGECPVSYGESTPTAASWVRIGTMSLPRNLGGSAVLVLSRGFASKPPQSFIVALHADFDTFSARVLSGHGFAEGLDKIRFVKESASSGAVWVDIHTQAMALQNPLHWSFYGHCQKTGLQVIDSLASGQTAVEFDLLGGANVEKAEKAKGIEVVDLGSMAGQTVAQLKQAMRGQIAANPCAVVAFLFQGDGWATHFSEDNFALVDGSAWTCITSAVHLSPNYFALTCNSYSQDRMYNVIYRNGPWTIKKIAMTDV